MKNEEWSEGELVYFTLDISVAEIARQTGRTIEAVYKKKQRLGFSDSFDPADKKKPVPAVGVFLNNSNEIIIAIDRGQKDDVVIKFNKS